MQDANWLRGAASGFLATFPMTAAMLAAHRLLPAHQRYPLPPRLITERWLEHERDEGRIRSWTLINHFAFGAVAGALYTAAGLDKRRPAISGPAYGVGVWAASYLGWVPALGLMPPATRQPAGRNTMMIAAHVVWGVALACAAVALTRNAARPARRSSPAAVRLPRKAIRPAASGAALARHLAP